MILKWYSCQWCKRDRRVIETERSLVLICPRCDFASYPGGVAGPPNAEHARDAEIRP